MSLKFGKKKGQRFNLLLSAFILIQLQNLVPFLHQTSSGFAQAYLSPNYPHSEAIRGGKDDNELTVPLKRSELGSKK